MPATGKTDDSGIIDGERPPPCPATTGVNVVALGGLPYDELADWLGPRVTASD